RRPSAFLLRIVLALLASQEMLSLPHPRVNFSQPTRLLFCRFTAVHSAADHVLDELFFAFMQLIGMCCAFDCDLMPCRLVVEIDVAKNWHALFFAFEAPSFFNADLARLE